MSEAEIYHYLDGTMSMEMHYVDGKPHREDGPAEIGYHKDGSVSVESYYRNGILHREDGPAIIEYDRDGGVIEEKWFTDDNEFTPSPEQVAAYRNRSKAACIVDGGMGN